MDGSLEAPTNNYQSLNRSSKKVVPGSCTRASALTENPSYVRQSEGSARGSFSTLTSSWITAVTKFIVRPSHCNKARSYGYGWEAHSLQLFTREDCSVETWEKNIHHSDPACIKPWVKASRKNKPRIVMLAKLARLFLYPLGLSLLGCSSIVRDR